MGAYSKEGAYLKEGGGGAFITLIFPLNEIENGALLAGS